MLFNSYPFLFGFLPLTLVTFLVARQRSHALALAVLLAASLIFYAWWDAKYVLLLGASILINYGLSLALSRTKSRGLLAFGIALNLATLAWFKYAFFVYSNFFWYVGDAKWLSSIILPLGISFYTFEQIAYLIDIKRGRIRPRGIAIYGLFVTFFPHLIAGPIILYQDLAQQFATRRTLASVNLVKFHSGLLLFAIGLAKKVVIADTFASFATPVFTHIAKADVVLGSADAWIGALAYTLQLYFDFSGYSDMAVGLARMMGFRLPFNFNSPYQAVSIIDFWRRWHMTLTNFFRKYVYIPLGGNREGLAIQLRNIMIVFGLTGLWHGAGWTFIVWGLVHGLLVAGNLIYRRHVWPFVEPRLLRVFRSHHTTVHSLAGWAVTLPCVVLLWVLFRSADLASALRMFKVMLLDVRDPAYWYITLLFIHDDIYHWAIPALALSWACVLLLPNSRAITASLASGRAGHFGFGRRPTGLRAYAGVSAVALGLLLFSAITLIGHSPSEFIYFQF